MEKTQVIVSNIYVHDENTKEEIRILGEIVFGRSEGNKNYPDDAKISRKHFRIIPAEDIVLIEDLGSTNKTRVNGKALKPNTLYKLRSRDVIVFGSQKLRIFIGGQIVAEKTKQVTQAGANFNAPGTPDSSIIFERFAAPTEAELKEHKKFSDSSLEISEVLIVEAGKRASDVQRLLVDLSVKKGAAWYLQFEGSEFGPLTFKELKAVLKNEQFKGGELFVFSEGLDSWTPVSALDRLLKGPPGQEETSTVRLDHNVPLAATVHAWPGSDRKNKVACVCVDIGLADITVTANKPLVPETERFEIEVFPLASTGIEKFRAVVKLSPTAEKKETLCLLLLETTPRTRAQIEKYLRTKS